MAAGWRSGLSLPSTTLSLSIHSSLITLISFQLDATYRSTEDYVKINILGYAVTEGEGELCVRARVRRRKGFRPPSHPSSFALSSLSHFHLRRPQAGGLPAVPARRRLAPRHLPAQCACEWRERERRAFAHARTFNLLLSHPPPSSFSLLGLPIQLRAGSRAPQRVGQPALVSRRAGGCGRRPPPCRHVGDGRICQPRLARVHTDHLARARPIAEEGRMKRYEGFRGGVERVWHGAG